MSVNKTISLNMIYLNNTFLPLFYPHPLSWVCPLTMLVGSISFFFIRYGNNLVNVSVFHCRKLNWQNVWHYSLSKLLFHSKEAVMLWWNRTKLGCQSRAQTHLFWHNYGVTHNIQMHLTSLEESSLDNK